MRTLLLLLSRFAAILPLGVALAIGRSWGFFAGNILRLRRSEVLERLAWAMPETTPDDRRHITDGMYRHFGMTAMEVLRMAVKPATELLARVDCAGVPPMRDGLARGKGLLVICAHLGNWELLAAATSASGLPLGITVKDLKPPALDDFVSRVRSRHGIIIFRRKGSMRPAIRHVRAGGVLGFMMDQNTKRNEGIFTTFFGRTACTTPGLAQFAALTGAPAMTVLMVREENGRHRMVCGKETLEPPPDLSEESVRAYTQKALDSIEQLIRQHPEQWIWMHRRWRTQPLPVESPAPARVEP